MSGCGPADRPGRLPAPTGVGGERQDVARPRPGSPRGEKAGARRLGRGGARPPPRAVAAEPRPVRATVGGLPSFLPVQGRRLAARMWTTLKDLVLATAPRRGPAPRKRRAAAYSGYQGAVAQVQQVEKLSQPPFLVTDQMPGLRQHALRPSPRLHANHRAGRRGTKSSRARVPAQCRK